MKTDLKKTITKAVKFEEKQIKKTNGVKSKRVATKTIFYIPRSI